MNMLTKEKAAYLKHSAYQKIDWYPWSEYAFEKAKKEDKPVFLSSGAIWCHWCHVMAKECFENEEIVKFLNEHFINIKLDRDERPDIDRTYQLLVIAMGYGGGWPLSAFLFPDKKPFFGGTYFPPEDIPGRPGFKKVLIQVIDLYKSKREDISQYTEKLMGLFEPESMPQGDISESLITQAVTSVLSSFDPQNGGFGGAPKFPAWGAVEFLINRYFFSREESVKYAVNNTLYSMAKGGLHDQIGGGFHRYSVDEAWIIPHFEKMADDNSWHLRNYVDAYALFGDEYFKKVACGIIRFIRDVLSDPEGGFFASQDADVTPDDEGGYFTWTEKDLRKALNDEEYRVLSLNLVNEKGSMDHDRSKKVLFFAMGEKEIAERLNMKVNDVTEIIKRGKEKLLRERNTREMPYVDRILYTSLNGMLITAYLKAFRFLKDDYLKDFAIKSLEKIMSINFINNELFHTEDVKAFLVDNIYLTEAFISAYEVTGNTAYLKQASELMDLCIDQFYDRDEGGFFDTDDEILGLRYKGIEDTPHPSANSRGLMLLLKLCQLTDKKEYYEYAEKGLKRFSPVSMKIGAYGGYYFCTLDAYFNSIKLTMATSLESKLSEAAISSFSPYMTIIYGEDKGCVIPCAGNVCHEPVTDPGRLKDFLTRRK